MWSAKAQPAIHLAEIDDHCQVDRADGCRNENDTTGSDSVEELGLEGFEAALGHDPAAVVTAVVTLKNGFDNFAGFVIGKLAASGRGGLIVATSGDAQGGTDRADVVASGLVDVANH